MPATTATARILVGPELARAEKAVTALEADVLRLIEQTDKPGEALDKIRAAHETYAGTQFVPRLRDLQMRILPAVTAAWQRIGLAALQVGRTDDAIAAFDDALRIDPSLTMTYSNRAIAQLRQGNLTAALHDIDEAISRADTASFRYNRGQILRRMNRLEDAEREYTNAIEKDTAHDKAWTNRGGIRFSRRDLKGSLADFEQALRINPRNTEALAGRGKALMRLGELDQAIEQFHGLLEIAPNAAKGHSLLGEVHLERQAWADARRCFAKALDLEPRAPEPHFGLAVLEARDANKDAAIEHLTRALKYGYRRYRRIKDEPAFASLAGDPRYDSLLAGMRRK